MFVVIPDDLLFTVEVMQTEGVQVKKHYRTDTHQKKKKKNEGEKRKKKEPGKKKKKFHDMRDIETD